MPALVHDRIRHALDRASGGERKDREDTNRVNHRRHVGAERTTVVELGEERVGRMTLGMKVDLREETPVIRWDSRERARDLLDGWKQEGLSAAVVGGVLQMRRLR